MTHLRLSPIAAAIAAVFSTGVFASNQATTTQNGSANSAETTQVHDGGLNPNQANTNQLGNGNTAVVSQNGSGLTSTIDSGVVSGGPAENASVSVTQQGAGHTLTLTQDNVLGAGIGDPQNPSYDVTVEQSDDGAHQATINQLSSNAAQAHLVQSGSVGANTFLLDQTYGNGHYVEASQTGDGGLIDIDQIVGESSAAGHEAYMTQAGAAGNQINVLQSTNTAPNGHYLSVAQDAAVSSSIQIEQVGNSHRIENSRQSNGGGTVVIRQEHQPSEIGGNWLTFTQEGTQASEMYVTQTTSPAGNPDAGATLIQAGAGGHYMYVDQDGVSVSAAVTQNGTDLYADLDQVGSFLDANILQSSVGASNDDTLAFARVDQTGEYNLANIHQVSGTNHKALITQSGFGAGGAWNEAYITQTGGANFEATITQTGGAGNSATINQSAS